MFREVSRQNVPKFTTNICFHAATSATRKWVDPYMTFMIHITFFFLGWLVSLSYERDVLVSLSYERDVLVSLSYERDVLYPLRFRASS